MPHERRTQGRTIPGSGKDQAKGYLAQRRREQGHGHRAGRNDGGKPYGPYTQMGEPS